MSSATKPRRPRARPYRDDRPWKCGNCLRPIVRAVVAGDDGRLPADPASRKYVVLDAEERKTGRFEYLRGPLTHPVVRELDELGQAQPTDTHRYRRHADTAQEER